MSTDPMVRIAAAGLDTDTAQKAIAAGWNLTQLRAAPKKDLRTIFDEEEVERVVAALQRKEIDETVVAELVKRCGWSCCVCWNYDAHPPVIIHHIVAHAKTADDSYLNLVVLCLNHHGEAHSKWEISRHPLPPERIRTLKTAFENALAEFRAGKRPAPGREGGGGDYQKRVMDRLAKLSDDLYSEFNPASDRYLTEHNGLTDALRLIHADFHRYREEILAAGSWDEWIILASDTLRMEQIVEPVRSDPFIPDHIRSVVVDLLERRLSAFSDVANEVLVEYRDELARGKLQPDEMNWVPLLNKINAGLAKQGCAPGHVEESVHRIRRVIQEYLGNGVR
jgi:hypothetical protein